MLKKIKGWFTRQSGDIKLDETSNINALGVARNTDIKTLIKQIEKIKNVIDNLPPPTQPPDLTPYALKDQSNEFTESQSIKNDAAFWEFKNSAGRRVGYVGKPSSNSNNIGLVNENGDTLVKATGDVKLEVGARNGVIGERAPTANNHLTNKKYVDDKIRQEIDAIPPLDLSDFASLTQDNQFTGNNQFNNGVNFQNATNLNGDAKYFGNVTENKHVATKEYVDSKSSAQPKITRYGIYVPYNYINKTQLATGIWAYNLYNSINFSFDTKWYGKKVFLKVYLNGINNEINLKFMLLHNRQVKIPDNGNFQLEMTYGVLAIANKNITITSSTTLNLIIEIIENIEIMDNTIPYFKEKQ